MKALSVGRRMVAAIAAMAVATPVPVAASAAGREPAATPFATVPLERVLNEVRCDYLDFAYSDYARARRLAVGRISGTVTLSLARVPGARGETFGVPVASGGIRLEAPVARRLDAPPADNALTVPLVFDPSQALDPAAAGLDCSPAVRLARPILEVTALAAALARAGPAGEGAVRSPLRYQGQFYLAGRAPERVEPVATRIDPARIGADAIFLQSFDMAVETGTPSWFADVGPATSEPRPAVRRSATTPPGGRVLRVPRAPLSSSAAAPRRCVAGADGEAVCY